MLTDKRGGKIYSPECASGELGLLGASLLMQIPRDPGPSLAGTMDGESEKQ